jgi:ArsR family transcriptional regulator, arsenate/arsenite/antimonite-responsive transcriptional repressor
VTNKVVLFSRALADPTRWRIIHLTLDEALCVCELADILEMAPSTISSHVQIIRKAGLLESEKCGKWTYFRITSAHRPLIGALGDFFKTSADPTLSSDTARSRQRLNQRENSCCRGPVTLKNKHS